jgi:hypothetical protein
MTKIQNAETGFGHWILKFFIYLEFGACDLEFFQNLLIVVDFNKFEETVVF